MDSAYLRQLTRMIPVDETWAQGYNDPHVIASICLIKHAEHYTVRVTVLDKRHCQYEIVKETKKLSDAGTLYEDMLDNIFYVIPNLVTPEWLYSNGFTAVIS